MVATEHVETIEFLSRSTTRVRILTALEREGRLSQAALWDRVDASRTTVQRNLDALADRNWVAERNRAYEITTAGEWIVDDFTALLDTIAEATALGPAIEWMETVDADLDPRAFTVTTPDPGYPAKPVNRHVRNAEGADTLRLVLPVVGVRGIATIHERLGDRPIDVEVVCTPDVAETIRSSPEFREYYADLEENDGFRLLVYDGAIPYYLGLLETDDGDVREWARATYEAYRADAEPVDAG
jgi:predicted transcriptional regulator